MGREEWNRRYAGSELLWTAQPNRFLVAETEHLRPGRALDLACGEGRNAVWLAERGWEVVGVDFSDVALEKARALAAARGVDAQWVHADLLDFEPSRHAFDLVIAFYLQVPEGVRTPVLRRAADAVASGGTLLVVAHDSSNLERGYGGPQDASVLYSSDNVVGDLRDSGLVIERADVVTRDVQTPDGERHALDTLVRAARPLDDQQES
ncbi:MAG TPA: class I SAM-dependent methyltransferase [Gaiellaceae bacterium]|nr:class I SAM-dependent methyltransferase [Gaiellaceae bacterium]